MIQEYLNAQFIKISEDANFDKLKKTCSEVTKKINKNTSKIIAYSLIAFDPEIPADNPNIIEIKDMIIKNWQTFLNNTKDTSVTIIRAVMLDALKTVSSDLDSARLIWLSSRNLLKHFKLGREKEILSNFILEIGNRIDNEVSKSWSFPINHSIEIPKAVASTIDEGDLTTSITSATIKIAIDKVLRKQIGEIKESQNEFADQVALMQVRTQLLWWKEACYSTSQKISYKDMKEGQLHILLAYDYSTIIPALFPASVDYFLVETLRYISNHEDNKIKISEFLKLIEQCSSELTNIIPVFNFIDGRISLLNFIQGIVHGNLQVKEFKKLVGISDSNELTFEELTLWLFHDIHSTKQLKSK